LLEILSQPETEITEAFRVPPKFGVNVTDYSTGGTTRVTDAKTFKSTYRLINRHGMRAEEPDEEKVGRLDDLKRMKTGCLSQMLCFFFLVLIFFFTIRYYCYSCFAEFEKITVLQNFDLDFPVQDEKMHHYLGKCNKEGSALLAMLSAMSSNTLASANETYSGIKGKKADLKNSSGFKNAAEMAMRQQTIKHGGRAEKVKLEKELCDPSHDQIMSTCRRPPFGAPKPELKFPIPSAFTISIPCVKGACKHFDALKRLNLYVVCFVLVWIISFCALKKCFDIRLAHLQRFMSEAE